jgi:hypothetical protein
MGYIGGKPAKTAMDAQAVIDAINVMRSDLSYKDVEFNSKFAAVGEDNIFDGVSHIKSERSVAPQVSGTIITVDLNEGVYFNITADQNIAGFNLLNMPTLGATTISVTTINFNLYNVAWGNVRWTNGAPPIFTESVNILTFTIHPDGGVDGFVVSRNVMLEVT